MTEHLSPARDCPWMSCDRDLDIPTHSPGGKVRRLTHGVTGQEQKDGSEAQFCLLSPWCGRQGTGGRSQEMCFSRGRQGQGLWAGFGDRVGRGSLSASLPAFRSSPE